MTFPPSDVTFTCAVCDESVTVSVPYCHIPLLPSDWRLVRVVVDDNETDVFALGVYLHRRHVAAWLHRKAESYA